MPRVYVQLKCTIRSCAWCFSSLLPSRLSDLPVPHYAGHRYAPGLDDLSYIDIQEYLGVGIRSLQVEAIHGSWSIP